MATPKMVLLSDSSRRISNWSGLSSVIRPCFVAGTWAGLSPKSKCQFRPAALRFATGSPTLDLSSGRFVATYLDTLNAEQRRAVEHGVADGATVGGPLLVIAGAGSGKTNTLAHRVAHLIVAGRDPRRILLMTFSRRAAAEMAGRVERIARKVMGDGAGVMTDALTWAGTFHGIGARLLREYAEQVGLDPAFTIHDREDSADLMNLVRHEKGFSKTESRFPTKGTCLSIYSRCVNAESPIEQVIATSYPWCAGWAAELKELFAAYVEAKQSQNVLDYDDLLLYWARMVGDATLADDIGGRFDHVLVDEYQD